MEDATTAVRATSDDIFVATEAGRSTISHRLMNWAAHKLAAPAVLRADKAFVEVARVNKAAFFDVIVKAGFPDFSDSPFADTIFSGCCANGEAAHGVARTALHSILRDLQLARLLLRHRGGKPITRQELPSVLAKALRREVSRKTADEFERLMTTEYIKEVFARYDSDNSGTIDEREFCVLALVYIQLGAAFNASLRGTASEELDRAAYGRALSRLGFNDPAKVFQGQLADAVFSRADADGNGTISRAEFAQAAARLLRPEWMSEMRLLKGWPGDSASFSSLDALSGWINTLQTGDVILTKIDDAMGRYLQFGLDSPWNHACVVVRRTPIDGIPNERTEELLERFPFRRASHKFCSPGYCRCCDTHTGDFPASFFRGTGEIGLLEGTGEGVHLYDFSHRMFVTSNAGDYCAMAVVRLKDAPNRDDHDAINAFVKSVAGSLYSTVKDEIRDSLTYHRTDDRSSSHDSQLSGGTSYFCSQLVASFYRHMGWISKERADASVMPNDFISPNTPSNGSSADAASLSRPVELLPGQGSFEPLEVVWSSELGVKLPWPKKKATPKS